MGGLFRRHVTGRAQNLSTGGQLRTDLRLLGQAEIGDPELVELVDQQVGRLEVAVQRALLVGVMHRPGRELDVPCRAVRRERAFGTISARLRPST